MGKLIEPRILGFNPVDADTSALFVADKDNNEYKVFDSEGELYTPDGGVVSDRLDALEAGIPPIDDARIVALEGAKAQNDLDVADLQGRMTTAESDIDAVEATVAAEQLLLDQAQTDITNLQGDMATAQADIVTAKGVADATTIVANAHVARTDNPHAVTHTQVGADATGTAATAVSNHVASADPHAQYLKENATASEVEVLPLNDANNYFSTGTLGEQMQEAGAHMASTANPHSVTAAQVGLGNVTNESKATMFTNAALTGNPTAPTAADGDNDTSIATTAFATKAVSNHNSSASAHGLNVAATVGALPIPDAGGYYSTDTIDGALQSVGASLAQKANKVQEAWITPTLLNGWTEVSGYPVRYRKNQFGKVEFKGRMQDGAAGTQVFGMPFGYRALTSIEKPLAHGSATTFVRGQFNLSNNSIYITTAYTNYVDLSGLDFFTD